MCELEIFSKGSTLAANCPLELKNQYQHYIYMYMTRDIIEYSMTNRKIIDDEWES